MSKLTDKLFGTHSERELKRIAPLVDKIEALRPAMQALTNDELRAKTFEFKERLSKGETLDDILVEAYAAIREASARVLHMEPFRVQLIGGIILHQGRIAEMRTGEGKTLVATLPVYLNALEGKGVHVVTVNDYLAKRDAEQMGQVYRFMGLSCGVILNEMTSAKRKEAYACDITYVTNNELGFDYLRDNMAVSASELVLRGLHYCIIDEVDSILIDEARTPLIISGQSDQSTKIYEMCDILAKQMVRGKDVEALSKIDIISGVTVEETGDYLVDEKDKIVNLTAEGVKKVEDFFHLSNLADPENLEIQHCIILALRANNLMFKDRDYIVEDDEIKIVDEFTGRVMNGRRYSDGLHQAIEAKEHVKVKQETKTLATITFQNFFNKFDKKCGMTGTAITEEQEFRDIYGMDVVTIPTNMPIARVDEEDRVYKTHKEKVNAIIEEIVETHRTGQPVLVGTASIESSEEISKKLKRTGIYHHVLNAKNHALEAEIIAKAGERGAVTIATNMAGRGTDIKLDDSARAAGGLKVIGTERHESRRIDNQLRGRSGRQGDPGESVFFLSLEDDLMRLFGADRYIELFDKIQLPEGEQIHHKSLSKAIESAQKNIESTNFGMRKDTLEYDQVMNEQREIIYKERRDVLEGADMRAAVMHMLEEVVKKTAGMAYDSKEGVWDTGRLNTLVTAIIPMDPVLEEEIRGKDKESVTILITEKAKEFYHSIEEKMGDDMRNIERAVILSAVDNRWQAHIDDMEQIRQTIHLQTFAQRDPKIEYKIIGYDTFNLMTDEIMEDVVRSLCHIRFADEAAA